MNRHNYPLSALITLAVFLGISFGCSSQTSNGSTNLLGFLPGFSSSGSTQVIPPAVSNSPSKSSSSSKVYQSRPPAGAPPPAKPQGAPQKPVVEFRFGAGATQSTNQTTLPQKPGASSFPGNPYRVAVDLFLLSIGLAGSVLGGLALRRLFTYRIPFDKYRREVQHYRTQLGSLEYASQDISSSFARLTEKINRLEGKLRHFGNQLDATQSSLAAVQQEQFRPTRDDPYSTTLNASQHPSYSISNPVPQIPASYATNSQPQPPTSALSDLNISPRPQSSADKKRLVTAAFNNGDRQMIRTETSALLNITSESENAIGMGQTLKTELQEESAGGSYCLVQISGEAWLYPSEQTLKSFSEYQPAKGVFKFISQAIHSPQILSPALIVKSGSVWRVEQIGRIAVPG
jgi:hypothetical protein